MAVSSRDYELAPVKFSRLPKHGLLLGFTLPQLVCLGLAGATIVAALYAGGGTGVAWTTPLWLTAAVAGLVPVSGRRLVEWAPIAARWAARTWKGQTMFRRNLDKPRPAGTLALPGDMAGLRQWHDPKTGAVMVHDPNRATLTAVVAVTHPAFVLLDPQDQQRRVQTWGRVLASCCRSGRIARLQVLESAEPDTGTGLAGWWAAHGHDDGSATAQIYKELIERAGPASERHTTTISLALDMRAAGRAMRSAGGGIRGAAAVLAQEMGTLTTALRSADLHPGGWLGPDDLARMLRCAYDPGAATLLQRHPAIGNDLADAGPLAVTETWAGLRTDTAWHTVLWVSEWPRSQVFPGFLAPILLSSGVRRSFSLLVTPLRADLAAKDLRRKHTEHVAEAAQRAKIGQIEDPATTAEYTDVLAQETDLANGHGVARYTGLIAITADDPGKLAAAQSAVEQAAIQASCETRLLVGQQAQAFTAATLPLCRET